MVLIKRRYTSNAVAYEDAVLSFPTPFLHTPAVGDYPDGTPVGSDGPLWTRFAAARDPVEDGLEYVQGDRSPWIPRGSGVFDNASKTFTGEWDAGMVRSRKPCSLSRSPPGPDVHGRRLLRSKALRGSARSSSASPAHSPTERRR